MANLDAVAAALSRIAASAAEPFPAADVWSEGERLLAAQRRALFGPGQQRGGDHGHFAQRSGERRRAGREFVAAGLDCARINCAHDDARGLGAPWPSASGRAGEEIRPRLRDPDGSARTEMPRRNAVAEEARAGSRRRTAFAWRSPGGAKPPAMPVVTISFPEVVARLPCRRQVWIDDGKNRGRVVDRPGGTDRVVEVVGARAKRGTAAAGKGVDFPGRRSICPPFRADDFAALAAIVEHADMIGFSFVQRPQDIVDLDQAIEAVRPGRPRCRWSSRSRRPRRCATCPV